VRNTGDPSPRPKNAIVILLDSLNRHMLGAYGGIEFWQDPSVVRIIARSFPMLATGGSTDDLSSGDPGLAGDYRIDVAPTGGTPPTGEGVLVRLTVQAVGIGASQIHIDDQFNGGSLRSSTTKFRTLCSTPSSNSTTGRFTPA
jgi:hypothetical protein